MTRFVYRGYETPNTSGRRKAKQITMALIHYTGEMNLNSVINTFVNRSNGVSAHYVIDRSGDVCVFNTPLDILWHGGKSQWLGRGQVNKYSIGYELMGENNRQFTDDQYDSLEELLQKALFSYPTIDTITGHEHVAGPSVRSEEVKVDPGPTFEWWRVRTWMSKYDWENVKWIGGYPSTVQLRGSEPMPSGRDLSFLDQWKPKIKPILPPFLRK
jgi:N-acetyl-anhydromuramyl-L-alanine amidase AmpD